MAGKGLSGAIAGLSPAEIRWFSQCAFSVGQKSWTLGSILVNDQWRPLRTVDLASCSFHLCEVCVGRQCTGSRDTVPRVMLQRHRLCLRAYEACQWPWSSQPIGTQEATGQRGVYSLLGPASLGLDLGTTREHYRKHPERMVSRHLRLALCSYENTQFWHMKIPLIFSTGLAIFRVQLTM